MLSASDLHVVHDFTPFLVAQVAKPNCGYYCTLDNLEPDDEVMCYWILFGSECIDCLTAATDPAYMISMN